MSGDGIVAAPAYAGRCCVSREVWPGRPFPLGPDLGRPGHQLLAVLASTPSASSCACSTTTTTRSASSSPTAPRSTGTATCPASGPASATATACTARTSPSEGHRFNPVKLLIDPYAKAIEGAGRLGRGQRAALRPRPERPEDADLELDDEDAAAAIPKSRGRRPALRLGGRPPAAHAVDRDGHLRGARQGLHQAAPRGARGPARHLRAAWPSERGDRATSRTLGVTAVELLPVHHIADESFLHEQGADELLGLQLDRLPRAARRVRRDRRHGEQVREFKGMVKALHRAGIEVILDVVYNHTAEGNHLGPMLSFKGVDNTVLLPARARRPAPLHGLHGHRQHAQRRAPERAAADHGLAALLGHRVPRRRLPLRPRLARSRASSTTSTACRRSSTRSTRTRCSRRSS